MGEDLPAVMFGEVNPENALSEYRFEYGPCEKLVTCATATTGVLSSRVYGTIGVTQEASGLQPRTTYCYRLVAESENQREN
jgi:hypothetical protein